MATKLQIERKKTGLTQDQVATELNKNQSAVARDEKKGITKTTVANEYARVLGVNPIFLLEGITTGEIEAFKRLHEECKGDTENGSNG